MKRSKLRNDFLTDRNGASQSAYRKQSNLFATLLRKSNKTVFLEFRCKIYNRKQKIVKIS